MYRKIETFLSTSHSLSLTFGREGFEEEKDFSGQLFSTRAKEKAK